MAVPLFSSTEEVVSYMEALFSVEGEGLGFAYVGLGNEQLVPKFPALIIVPGPVVREIHGTHQFKVTFNEVMYIYHAELSISHKARTIEDLKLVAAVVDRLHEDMTLGGNVIYGWVDSEAPGMLHRQTESFTTSIVGTRITWQGEVRQSF